MWRRLRIRTPPRGRKSTGSSLRWGIRAGTWILTWLRVLSPPPIIRAEMPLPLPPRACPGLCLLATLSLAQPEAPRCNGVINQLVRKLATLALAAHRRGTLAMPRHLATLAMAFLLLQFLLLLLAHI